MKRILLGVIAITVMSATLYADNGKITKKIKSKAECCSKGCCNEDCTRTSNTVYAAKRGIVLFKTNTCTCC